VRGAIVSDHVSYHFMSREGFAKASDPSGLTHPPELLGEIAPLIRGSRDLAPDEILRFAKVGPEALMRPFDFHDPLEHLKWALASAETSRRVGRFLWERQRPDLLMVYVEGTDSVSHLFGHLFRAKPLFTGLLLQQRRYGQTVEEMYRWADRLVGEYLKLLDERTTLVVVSDHGFRLGELPDDPSEAGRPVGHKYHRLEGVLYLYGYGVKPGATLDRPTVLDLTPTLLALLGIPAAGDMPGRVLAEALTLPVPAPVSTHEGGPPHSVDDGASPGSSVDAEIVERLRALGYVGDGSPGGDVNAAQGLFDAGHFEEAARAYEKLVGAHPKDPALRVSLAAALGSLGRSREAQAQLDVALQLDSLNAAAYFNRGALREAKGEQGAAVVDYRNALRCRPGFKPGADALKRLTGSESASPPRDGAERRAFALAGEAAELAQRGAYAEANRKLDEAVRAAPRYAPVHQYRANVAYLKGDRAAAVAALRRALQLEPDNVVVEENLRRLESGR
jgi:Flp pilus assembly protein TadD